MNGGGAEREGDIDSEAGFRIPAVSTEPHLGLELTDHEIMIPRNPLSPPQAFLGLKYVTRVWKPAGRAAPEEANNRRRRVFIISSSAGSELVPGHHNLLHPPAQLKTQVVFTISPGSRGQGVLRNTPRKVALRGFKSEDRHEKTTTGGPGWGRTGTERVGRRREEK